MSFSGFESEEGVSEEGSQKVLEELLRRQKHTLSARATLILCALPCNSVVLLEDPWSRCLARFLH